MDPTANLREQLELAHFIQDNVVHEDAARLALLVIELDSWLKRGGFLPSEWMPEPFRSSELDRRRQTGDASLEPGPH